MPATAVGTTAGSDYFARTWQTDDGLPRNTISAMAQTPDGYLWLGTPLGVIRFDGITFLPMEDEYYAGFVRARTRVLYSDNRGRLWIGTGTAGVIRLEGKDFTIINSQNGLPHPTITAICEDSRGTVWLASQDGSLSWVDSEDVVHPVAPVAGGAQSAGIQLVRDGRGRLWFAQRDTYGQLLDGVATNVTRIPEAEIQLCPSSDGGMWVCDGFELQKLSAPDSSAAMVTIQLPLKRNQVQSLLEDRKKNLWIGTRSQGLFRYADGKFTQEFASTHRIPCLYEDAEANLWVGTEGGGISRLRPRIFHTINVREGLPNSMVLSLCESVDGDLWLSPQGPALLRRNSNGELADISGFTNIGTTCVLPNSAGGIWVGTVNQGLYSIREGQPKHISDQGAFRNRQIRVLHQDAKGQLWLGCLPEGLARLSNDKFTKPQEYLDQGLPKQAIWAMADDRDQHLWLGTIRGELWRYDGTNFTSYGEKDGLPGATIGALLATSDGNLWIGTLGGGLGRLRRGHFVFADVRQGLADDVISGIVDDGSGYLWLGSERGIMRLRKQDFEEFAAGKRHRFETIHYGRNDGLASVECSGGFQPSAWRTRSGEIWFATSKGAVAVTPTSLNGDPHPPKLVLEKIQVDEVEVTSRSGLKIPSGYGELAFTYSAPSFSSPERIRFRHQLIGLDADWVEAGTTRTVSYPRLAPGSYVFRFTAGSADGVWNETPVTVAFEVLPAYWQTNWFRGLALLLFGLIVAGGVRYRYVLKMRRKLRKLEQAHAIEQERMRIARDIHDDLGARLTQMAFLSEMTVTEMGERSPAGERLTKIADGSRSAIRSLEEIVWAVNPQKDSLPHLLDYLSHYANEFFRATDIRCRQDLPLIIPEITLSAECRHHLFLACKEALNNIHKHAGATEVWLRMTIAGADLEVIIEDNGRGLPQPPEPSAGNGLLNLQSRLSAIDGQCHVTSTPGGGARVCFKIKLPPHPAATHSVAQGPST